MKEAAFIMSTLSILLWFMAFLGIFTREPRFELYEKACNAQNGTAVLMHGGIICVKKDVRIIIPGLDNK